MEEKEFINFDCASCNKKESINLDRVISKLDEYLGKDDYNNALRHLLYWKQEANAISDLKSLLSLDNELIGIYRKTSKKEEAYQIIEEAIKLVNEIYNENNTIYGTTYLNSATAFKAFNDNNKAYEYYSKALEIYLKNLDKYDYKLGALYNNMALVLTALKDYDKALNYYNNAIEIMNHNDNKELEIAMTYLNIANLLEDKEGMQKASKEIDHYLVLAMDIFDSEFIARDSYYAFVLSKCESVYSYYGYIVYAKELRERSASIYERNRLS